MNNNLDTMRRWTHAEQGVDQAEIVRTHVFNYFMSSIKKAHINIENDIIQQLKDESARKILDALLFKNATIEDLRASLGKITHHLNELLNPKNDTWDVLWSTSIEDRMSEDVKISYSVLQEAINRSYGNEIDEVRGMWTSFAERRGKKVDNPLNIMKFIRAVHNTQISQGVEGRLQALIFLELEQEIIQTLGIVLFEIRSRLIDFGVAAPDKIDTIIQKRKNVFGVNDTQAQAVNDEALFKSLVELLQGWEPEAIEKHVVGGTVVDGGDHLKPLNTQEIFSAIATLQQWAPKVLEEALGQPDGRLGQHIKDSLIKQAEALGVPAGRARISAEDENAVDLVDEVFTQNLYKRRMQQASRTILAQILFPSVKAAILNRRWFAEQTHPARKFLESVADACAPADGILDQKSVDYAKQAVDKLVAGFNEDVSIFEVLTQEIQHFKQENAWGSDTESETKEQKTRLKIKKELQEKWMWWRGPKPVMDFCLQLGSEYLSDLESNQERGSMQWGAAMGALDNLLRLRSDRNERVKIDGFLRDNLMKMLTSSGWTGVRAHNLLAEQEDVIDAYYVHGRTDFTNTTDINDLLKTDLEAIAGVKEKIDSAPPIASEVVIADKLAEKISVGSNEAKNNLGGVKLEAAKTVDPETPEANVTMTKVVRPEEISSASLSEPLSEKAPVVESTPNEAPDTVEQRNDNLKEKTEDVVHKYLDNYGDASLEKPGAGKTQEDLLSTINQLQIGSHSTWINGAGEMCVLRLSWISPISMKYLFVNNKGARVLVGNPEELLDMATKGRFFPNTTLKK